MENRHEHHGQEKQQTRRVSQDRQCTTRRRNEFPYPLLLVTILAMLSCQSPSSFGTNGFAVVRQQPQQQQRGSFLEAASTSSSGNNNGGSAGDGTAAAPFDTKAFEMKNAARKKFGLKPLTMDQFLEVQGQIQDLAMQQQQKASAVIAQRTEQEEEEQKRKKKNNSNVFSNLFGNVVKDTCESNYDCSHPQVCCDFGFMKKCCSSGSRIPAEQQYATVPIPVDMRDAYGNPPQ